MAHILARILNWIFPEPPRATTWTATDRRRQREPCDVCGKDIAVIASTGKLWKHNCHSPFPVGANAVDLQDGADLDIDGGPGPHDQHDRLEEVRGER